MTQRVPVPRSVSPPAAFPSVRYMAEGGRWEMRPGARGCEATC